LVIGVIGVIGSSVNSDTYEFFLFLKLKF